MSILITIEGADGTGKSTLSHSLATALGGLRVAHPFSPNLIADLQNPDLPAPSALDFIADQILSTHTRILPALRAGQPVIADRYRLSTLVYQTLEGNAPSEIFPLQSPLLTPDLEIVLLSPNPSSPLPGASQGSRYETPEARAKAQALFIDLAGSFKIAPTIFLSTDLGIPYTHRTALNAIHSRFPILSRSPRQSP